MKRLLLGLLLRFAKGERYEKIPPLEMRCQFAVFAFIPIFLLLINIGLHLLPTANVAIMSLYILSCLLITCLVVIAWAWFIPLRVSKIAAVTLWILVIWVVWHIDLAKLVKR